MKIWTLMMFDFTRCQVSFFGIGAVGCSGKVLFAESKFNLGEFYHSIRFFFFGGGGMRSRNISFCFIRVQLEGR